MDNLFIYNLDTKKLSTKSWKTYNGAFRNLNRSENSIVTSKEGADWLEKHPEWIEERLNKQQIK